MKILIPVLGGLLFGNLCFAQARNDNPMKTRLDSVVNKAANLYLSKPGRMGISIGITKHKGTWRYNYGKIAPGSNESPSSNSIYEIGSITKTFTGLLVAKAIVEGRISLNDDICKYLPESFPNLIYQ